MKGLSQDWSLDDVRYPQPDWMAVADHIADFDDEVGNDFWDDIVARWVASLCGAFGATFRLFESPNFYLVADTTDSQAGSMLKFLEECLVQIRESLPCLVDDTLEGKCPVLIIPDYLFYEYLGDYTVDEDPAEHATIGGVYLSRGHGHFVVPGDDLTHYVDVFSHELCHALVAPLELPAWLDEAIAVTMENRVTGMAPYILDREIIAQHEAYWTEERIQGFWKGESFTYPDDGQDLSYHLAQFLLNAIYQGGETPPELLNEFILESSREDAGVGAARRILDYDLPMLLTNFLGEGNWEPRNLFPEPS